MKIAFRIVILGILAGLGFGLWTVLFPSPERIVLKKVSDLAETATIGAEAGNFERAGKVSSIIGYFSTDAQIIIEVRGAGTANLNGRDEIRETAGKGFMGLKSLNVKFLDATASVAPDKQNAEVDCTAEIHVNDNPDIGAQEIKFTFKKIEKEWMITRVESVKTLQ